MVTEVTVERLMYGGEGLARVDGRVVLVPFVLPGERVKVEIYEQARDYHRARLLEVLDPSPHRVQPPCEHFQKCGGCHYQHAAYTYQLELKRSILIETCRRIGKFAPPDSVRIVSGPDLDYRNRTQFHIDRRKVGFHRVSSHRLCPVRRCPISSPMVNQALAVLWRMIPHPRFPDFIRVIEFFTNENQVQVNVLETRADRRVARGFFEWCAREIPGALEPAIEYPAAGHLFRVSHRSFFQVNRFLIDQLVDVALEGAAGQWAVDLYAGVGLFSLPMATRFARVVAVETSASAIADLRFNAERAGLAVEAVRSTADLYLSNLGSTPDFVLADPPRAGLGRAVVRELKRLHPRRLVLVSCNPATLARDLGALLSAGYEVASVSLVDLFPHTYHIESVWQLEWRGDTVATMEHTG